MEMLKCKQVVRRNISAQDSYFLCKLDRHFMFEVDKTVALDPTMPVDTTNEEFIPLCSCILTTAYELPLYR